jgi:hypothetical protein
MASQFFTTLMLPCKEERIRLPLSAVFAEFADKIGFLCVDVIAVGRMTFMPFNKK